MENIRHGIPGGYSNYKCRCNLCKKAWAEYHKNLKELKKLQGICIECSAPVIKNSVRCEKHKLRQRVQKKHKESSLLTGEVRV